MKITDREDIQADLSRLVAEARNLLENKRFSLQETRILARLVAELRMMLDMLWQIEGKLKRSDALVVATYHMKEEFLELEGMVKELRNTMERDSFSRPGG